MQIKELAMSLVPQDSNILKTLEQNYEKEKDLTIAARNEVIKFLSHDQSTTREHLVQALQERIEAIQRDAAFGILTGSRD